jgi:hypothetical protein
VAGDPSAPRNRSATAKTTREGQRKAFLDRDIAQLDLIRIRFRHVAALRDPRRPAD